MASNQPSTVSSMGEGIPGAPSAPPLYAPPKRLPAIDQGSSPLEPFDENDSRVYFDRQSGSWKCETEGQKEGAQEDDIIELEWDQTKKSWVPLVDDDLIKAQQAAYSVQGVDEDTPASAVERRNNKRRRSPNADGNANSSKQPRAPKARINSSVFVTGLPLDATKDEIASVFARYGVINEDDAGEPRIKMYADERTGVFKGEALVTYFKEESIDLATRVLDESALRAAEGKTHPIMRVEKAQFGTKEQAKEVNKEEHERRIGEAQNRSSVGEARNGQQQQQQQQRRQMTEQDKKRAQKRYAKMNNKLTDWNSDSDEDLELLKAPSGKSSGSGVGNTVNAMATANSRQVCLRRMFTLAELEEDPTLLLDLKEDVREECENLGKVTNVVLWDKEPEGIMTVKFGSVEAAQACIEKMDGRFFAGRQVIAHLLESKPRFKRSDRGGTADEDEEDRDEEEQKRHDAFGDWLEAGGDGQGGV